MGTISKLARKEVSYQQEEEEEKEESIGGPTSNIANIQKKGRRRRSDSHKLEKRTGGMARGLL